MYFSYFLVYFGVIGASAADNNFRKALQLSDKICSVNFDPKEGRFQRVFETVTGFMLPSYLTTHDTSPYSGFKILKTYTFRPTSLRSETRFGVAFCGQGKVQWQTSTQLQDDIEWDKPFCIYNPDYGSQKKAIKASLWSKVWHRVTASSKHSNSLRTMAKGDIENFHCFKLARRKKYFGRSNSLFFPGSWVGGLFYCDLDNDMKSYLLDISGDDLTLSDQDDLDLCTVRNSIPLLPLESDNYGKSWLEYENSKLLTLLGKVQGFQVTKYVPFLFTPNSQIEELNFKNSERELSTKMAKDRPKAVQDQIRELLLKSTSSSNTGDPWYSEIDVEENYMFSPEEIKMMDRLTDKTLNLLNRLSLSSRDSVNKFLSAPESLLPNGGTAKRLRKYFHRMEAKIWEYLPVYDKNLAVMTKEPEQLQESENEWKNMRINGRKYKYSIY